MKIVSAREVVRNIMLERNRYVCYLGAGASVDAGVKTAFQICDEVRANLGGPTLEKDQKQSKHWDTQLKWNSLSERYSTCMDKGFDTQSKRVQYFRAMLKGIRPSFCHHALALLMAKGYFKHTCLTTNFDKLLESAFAQQAITECQPIRTEGEFEYWEDNRDGCYVIKLHGDYDTNNVLNTTSELSILKTRITNKVRDLLRNAGLVVIGTAGYESSIITLLKNIISEEPENQDVLSRSLYWGVFMGCAEPHGLTQNQLEKMVLKRISDGVVSEDIHKIIGSQRKEPFSFFPIWGAGSFMWDIIKEVPEEDLRAKGELFLDHEMRLRNVFTGRLPDEDMENHLKALRAEQKKLLSSQSSSEPQLLFTAQGKRAPVEVWTAYGDIMKLSQSKTTDLKSLRRAIVSPEDTFITAGGGVAYLILEEAGKHNILNELAKFSPVEQGTVVVTSGGNLPLHYIFHAAALDLIKNSKKPVSKSDVSKTVLAALQKAKALDVGALWLPLLGAGVGGLKHKESFESILEAINTWSKEAHKIVITIVIYSSKNLPPNIIKQCLQRKLSKSFDIKQG